MYELASSGTDSQGADVVTITCSYCGYLEEHFTQKGLSKVGKPCDRFST